MFAEKSAPTSKGNPTYSAVPSEKVISPESSSPSTYTISHVPSLCGPSASSIVEVDNEANVSTIFGGAANTGNNEANQNTIGGSISTGDVSANAGIHNLINRVLLALGHLRQGYGGQAGGDEIIVDADLMNLLTGALSENENDVEANYDFLADIMNNGLVDNLVNLLLNTGGNTANENTDGASIVTGEGCVDVTIGNSVNTNSLAGIGSWSLDVTNTGNVHNSAGIGVTTGNNELRGNTNGGQQESEDGACAEKLAQAPEQPQVPGGVGGPPSPEASASQGGGDVGPDEPTSEGKVAGAVDEGNGGGPPSPPPAGGAPASRGILKRFPVAGAMSDALLLPGKRRSPWVAFALVSTLIVLAAYHLDRQTRQPLVAKKQAA